MGDMTRHFDRREFRCLCGCGKDDISPELVNKLEEIYQYCSKLPTGCKCIIVNSGCRCSKHSVAVGGYANDAHTCSIAADITVYTSDGVPYAPTTIAAIAEHLGFSGIGLMATNVHVDIRSKTNYVNAHWFGSEVTGENIDTFKKYLPALPAAKHKITVMYDGKTIIETEV